jgi:hypothetical protein
MLFCYASCMAPCVHYLADKVKSTKTLSFYKHAVAACMQYLGDTVELLAAACIEKLHH